jgi:segregation and condensation protein B
VAVNPNIIKTLHERNWIRVVGHRDVPGKPELLGTTRDFLDYFNLKKLDDLPTLTQLKELEDLRVQLTLPGAEPEVSADTEMQPDAAVTAPVDDELVDVESARIEAAGDATAGDEAIGDGAAGEDDEETPAREAAPRTQGLVASGAQDDAI